MSLLCFSNAGQLWGLVFSFADLNRVHGSAAKPTNKPFKNNGGPSSTILPQHPSFLPIKPL
jgi:hypothetical protein